MNSQFPEEKTDLFQHAKKEDLPTLGWESDQPCNPGLTDLIDFSEEFESMEPIELVEINTPPILPPQEIFQPSFINDQNGCLFEDQNNHIQSSMKPFVREFKPLKIEPLSEPSSCASSCPEAKRFTKTKMILKKDSPKFDQEGKTNFPKFLIRKLNQKLEENTAELPAEIAVLEAGKSMRKCNVKDLQNLFWGTSNRKNLRKYVHASLRGVHSDEVFKNKNAKHIMNYSLICKTFALRLRCRKLMDRVQAQ